MRITICRDPEAAAAAAASRVIAALRHQPALVLGLPTGQTPMRLYERLARAAALGRVNFSRATTFNVDEFVGLSPRSPASYRAFMERQLFSRVRLPRGRIHVLRGHASDLAAECARFERTIAAAGGLDLLLLGIGLNGHIAFNEPGPTLATDTHRATLAISTRRANAILFGGDVRRVPRQALSMGMGTLLKARRIILLATGREKARVVRRAVEGPVTTWLPASFLQLHPQVEILLDEAAAARLAR